MLGNVWRAQGERREIPGSLEDGESASPLKGICGIICGRILEILSQDSLEFASLRTCGKGTGIGFMQVLVYTLPTTEARPIFRGELSVSGSVPTRWAPYPLEMESQPL